MSRLLLRSGLILLILSTLGLLTYAASTLLFPGDDGTRFPQLNAPGTILSALETISSDTLSGTVRNTQQLGGIPASQFVIAGAGRAIDCGSSQYLVGISPAMTAICGTRGSTLLVLSVIYEAGGVGVKRVDGTVVSPAAVGTPIYEGDEVFTTTGSGTILFPDDTIVRLDSATQLTLTSGTGVHLDGGSLWARVLGDGDYSIGTDDLAVGVRGTSLYLSRVSPAPTTALILDSQGGDTTAAATLTCKTDAGAAQTQKSLSTQQMITATAAGCAATSISTKLSKDAFSVYPFVRRSQRADLVYLKRLKEGKYTDLRCDQFRYVGLTTGSAVTSPNLTSPFSTLCSPRTTEKLAKVSTEYDVSKPKDTTEQSKLCDTTGQVWWNDLGNGIGGCRESGVVAVADYTNGDGKMYFNGSSLDSIYKNTRQPTFDGGAIFAGDKVLVYTLPKEVCGAISGKDIRIELSSSLGTPTNIQRLVGIQQ